MTLKDRTTRWAPFMAILTAASNAGCQDRPDIANTVQHAVGTGSQGALRLRREASVGGGAAVLSRAPAVPASPTVSVELTVLAAIADPSSVPPAVRVEGSGEDARLVVQADEHHVAPSSARLGQRFGAAWTDRDGQTLRYASFDLQGRATGEARRVHEAVQGEESVASGSLVAAGSEGFAIAWVDGENGRVRFAALDAEGQRRGGSSIVHEGLEAPRTARLVWNGREFAVAVGLWQGVYFARINAQGERVSDGSVMAEGVTIRSLDELRAEPRGYSLGWTEDRDGQATRVRQLMGVQGHSRAAGAVVSSRSRAHRMM